MSALKRLDWPIVTLCGFALLAAAGWALRNAPPGEAAAQSRSVPAATVVPVVYVRGLGSVQAYSATVKSRVDGAVVKVDFKAQSSRSSRGILRLAGSCAPSAGS